MLSLEMLAYELGSFEFLAGKGAKPLVLGQLDCVLLDELFQGSEMKIILLNLISHFRK